MVLPRAFRPPSLRPRLQAIAVLLNPSVSAGLEESHSCRDFGASGSIFQTQARNRARERNPTAVAKTRTGGQKATSGFT